MRSLVVGVPGRKLKDINKIQTNEQIEHARKYYQMAKVHVDTSTDIEFK